MPHTQLFGSLLRTARLCRAARRRGVSVAQGREGQGDGGAGGRRLTRREFISAGAAAAAALAVPRWAFATGSGRPSVAIVGAGIAGLNCALTLVDRGVLPAIYEASGRVGGRMFSNQDYWSEGQVSEWCGELIDSNHHTIRRLAARFGLQLDDLVAAQPPGAEETLSFDGGCYPRAQAVQDFQPVYDAVQADFAAAGESTTWESGTAAGRRLDNLSLWSWIEQRVPGGRTSRLGQLLDVAYTAEYGADTRDQSALNLVYTLAGSDRHFETYGASDERYHIRGGNQQLPQALAAYLARAGARVQTRWPLAALRERPDGKYVLNFEHGAGRAEVVADFVVLALPFAVLRKLDYTRAGFDSLKDKTIRELGCGRNAKLQLQFTRRLWNEAGAWGRSTGTTFAGCGYQNTWEPTRGQGGSCGILNDFLGGSGVGRLRTREVFLRAPNPALAEDAGAFLAAAAKAFPGLAALWNSKATVSVPHRWPLFNCSYAYWRVGQYQSIAGYERVRQKNVLFAGEHTSVSYQGFMEGAAQEGRRAAEDILAQLGRRRAKRAGQAAE